MHTSMISRIFGGVEGKAMASNPPWSATSAIFMRLPPRRPRTSSHHPLQLVLCRLDNSLHGETKFPLEVLERCRGPEGPHADALAIRPDILRPAKNRRLFDRDPSRNGQGQDPITVDHVLVVEQFPRRHTDDAALDALCGELLVGCDAERDLAA